MKVAFYVCGIIILLAFVAFCSVPTKEFDQATSNAHMTPELAIGIFVGLLFILLLVGGMVIRQDLH